LQEFVGST